MSDNSRSSNVVLACIVLAVLIFVGYWAIRLGNFAQYLFYPELDQGQCAYASNQSKREVSHVGKVVFELDTQAIRKSLFPIGASNAAQIVELEQHQADSIYDVMIDKNGSLKGYRRRVTDVITLQWWDFTNSYDIVFSPDKTHFTFTDFLGSDYFIRLCDAADGKQVATFYDFNPVFNPDGTILATVNNKRCGTVNLRDSHTGQIIQIFSECEQENEGVWAIDFSPDGNLLAFSKNNAIEIWNVPKFEKLVRLNNHTDEVNAIAFSSDGKLLASSSRDDTIRLWGVPQT